MNDLLQYLNDKNTFQLRDIMRHYNISRSTAIRDIMSLEKIGMPLYSKQGRNGCYKILQNRLLSPIIFDMDEVSALYFSMLTLRAYESTPFHLSVEKLKRKFEYCLSPEKIEYLKKAENVFRLGTMTQNSHCEFLKDIFRFAVYEKACEVTYQSGDKEKSYILQFIDISASFGQWYVTGYNLVTQKIQIFRCDRILRLIENTEFQTKPIQEFKDYVNQHMKHPDAVEFEIQVSRKGVDHFYKENYPSMSLNTVNDEYRICGFYHANEETFIADYFVRFGESILNIYPNELAELIVKRLRSLQTHFLQMSSGVNCDLDKLIQNKKYRWDEE